MAEVEHFVDPETSKKHDRFLQASSIELPFLDKTTQLSGNTTLAISSIGEAVKTKLVDNESLGYCLARVYLFLVKIVMDQRKIRFRQHPAK